MIPSSPFWLTSSNPGSVIIDRFNSFLENITITPQQYEEGLTKCRGIISTLNNYYNNISSVEGALLVGSWGKKTNIRPISDIDLLFTVPYDVYQRFERRLGNKQSQLLQEVKGVLSSPYPNTAIKGDRNVVVVDFSFCKVEVIPAFVTSSGQFLICDAAGNGTYKMAAPLAEINMVDRFDNSNQKTRNLIKMIKCWKRHRNVPLKSFFIELISIDFLVEWPHRNNGPIFYDWMIRDFFAFLKNRANSHVQVPGTNEIIPLGNEWLPAANRAHEWANAACQNESKYPTLAGEEWQKIFGDYIPRVV
ncbi:MAG: hypothetical protein AB7G80_09585 [Dongiaceae bacterium]